MADNYLGKKMEDYMASRQTSATKRGVTLDKLLRKNRSHRGYDSSYEVREDQLRRIIEVNTKTPSAMNQQVLRFRPVLKDEAHKLLPHIRLGGALPELKLPLAGEEPNAFIVVCSDVTGRYVDIDLGISAQSMLLKAAEIGLNGICIAAFNHEAVKEALRLNIEPVLIIAIGRGKEKIELIEISADEPHTYYRRDGVHYVPKVKLDDLIIG
ncbi:MAG: nitroreductase [Rikenellaceae bacterium]|nr:nitroreductase [Rikenellaceae bacterium]